MRSSNLPIDASLLTERYVSTQAIFIRRFFNTELMKYLIAVRLYTLKNEA